MISPIFERATELQKQYRFGEYDQLKNDVLTQIVSAIFKNYQQIPSSIKIQFNNYVLFEFAPNGTKLYTIIQAILSDLGIEGSILFCSQKHNTFSLTIKVENF